VPPKKKLSDCIFPLEQKHEEKRSTKTTKQRVNVNSTSNVT
jgi:hypothetical protein